MDKVKLVNMKSKSGMKSKFSEAFRIKVAKEYLNSDQSHQEVGQKYGLKREQVRWFVKWYQQNHGIKKSLPAKNLSPEQKQDVNQLKELLQQKEKELSAAVLQIESLNSVIRIAEKSLNISIGKKSGAR